VSPTYEKYPRFSQDYGKLSREDRDRFKKSVSAFVEDLAEGRPPRPGLRVKKVQGAEGIFEMTWAPDGRATWEYGVERISGEPHINWRRIGTHDIFDNP
jgi:hypothetical protein